MLELLTMPFMIRAVVAGVLISLLASYYGVFVVQRGLSFFGSGLAHAAFGGVAAGLLLNVEPLWIAVPFTVFVAVGIIWVSERTQLGGDTAIGIFFSVSMALGIVFLSLRREYTAEAFAYLFGSILNVTPTDLGVSALVVALSAATWPAWSRWAYATFDRELALADRIPVVRDDYLLSVSLAVTVVVAVKVVGIVLVAAFLVIPAATARLLARTFFSMTLYSMGIGVASVLAGLFVSVAVDLPSGATIILVQAAVFFVTAMIRR